MLFVHQNYCLNYQPLQDWMLALGVVVLVAVDVIILAVYNVVEGVRGNLSATRVFNRENPEDKTGVCNYNWLRKQGHSQLM